MNRKNRIVDIVFAAVSIAVGAFFIFSASVIIPITVRGYYFLHCRILNIPGTSGYSMEEIRLAFNDIMDFIWLGKPFAEGNLPYSAEGQAHFQDCVPLFWADLIVFLVTLALLIAYFVLLKTKVLRPHRFLGITGLAWSAFGLLATVAAIGIYAAIDFDGLFVAFHALFFPGKGNWVFDETTDPIIKMLPESFFACCGAFIGTVALLLSGGFIGYSFATRKRYLRNKASE